MDKTLVVGESGLDTATNMLKVGDGVTTWAEDVEDKRRDELKSMIFLKYVNMLQEELGRIVMPSDLDSSRASRVAKLDGRTRLEIFKTDKSCGNSLRGREAHIHAERLCGEGPRVGVHAMMAVEIFVLSIAMKTSCLWLFATPAMILCLWLVQRFFPSPDTTGQGPK
jgi:hypothetical protein